MLTKKLKLILINFLTFILIFIPFFYSSAQFSTDAFKGIGSQSKAFGENAGYDIDGNENAITDTISLLIKVFLGFLGIIFIILIIWSGYNWMTAGGNEEKVTKARTTIYRAIIGLIIIVSAYAITHFVFGALNGTTTGI